MAVFARYRTEPSPPAEPDEPVGHTRIYLQLLPFEQMPL